MNKADNSELYIINFKDGKKGSNGVLLSELQSTVHTITNVNLRTPYINNPIPMNITSISFNFEKMNPAQLYDIIIPNSIVKLDLYGCLAHFNSKFFDKVSNAPKSFIPSSVTDLTTVYDERYKSKIPIIPSSVTKLFLTINDDCCFNLGLVPFRVKELYIQGSNYGGIKIPEASLPNSITKLTIKCGCQIMGNDNEIMPNSIPENVEDLNITFLEYPPLFHFIFPKSLTRLEINCKVCINPPPTLSQLQLPLLKYLKIDNVEIDLNNNNKNNNI